MIYTSTNIKRDMVLKADLCVIGSGAGGSPVAWTAAKQGKRVVVLEAGHFWQPKDFTQLEHEMFPRLYHDSGGRATKDKAVHIHQGKGVGGSTLHNINLCGRVPKKVEAYWREEHTLTGLSEKTLKSTYQEIEKHIRVSRLTESQLNGNNLVFKRGVDALGYKGGYLQHNRHGCAQSGFCELGCPFDAKQNALRSFIAPAVESGAMVLADTWATRLVYQGPKVVGVQATVREPVTGKSLHQVTIHADVFCVSASATGSAALLLRSDIPDPYRLVGSRLFIHPAVAVAGIFRETLNSWSGIPQSYECTEFMDFSHGAAHRVWLLPAFAHPVGASSILSGFGPEHAKYMKDYAHMASFGAVVHDETPGSVRPKGEFGVDIRYWPDVADRKQMVLGLREASRIMLAAGAKKALIPFAKTMELTSIKEIDKRLSALEINKFDLNITAVHPMGTVWMGDEPARSCVSAYGKYHHMDNLFVSDTSLFPSSLGAPPQLTTYTLGLHIGRHIMSML